MRKELTKAKLNEFIHELAKNCSSAGRVYLTGGASALLHDFRSQTVDIDIKFDPEPHGAFEAIAQLKEKLDVNIELAAPDQFVPTLPDWQTRSVFITSLNAVEFYHYDFYSQVLAKIDRGFENDTNDVNAFFMHKLIEPMLLKTLFERIKPQLIRFPAIEASRLEQKVIDWVERFSE